MAVTTLKSLFRSMFLSVEITYAVRELQSRKKLRPFLAISEIPSVDSLYRFLNRLGEDSFVSLIHGFLNSCCTPRRGRRQSTILIDGTAITLDLNWLWKTFSKKQLEKRKFRSGYAPSHGHFIGYKLN